MADFNFVTDRLATGASLTSEDDVNAILAAGINRIIDCRNDFDDHSLFIKHPQIQVLWNGTEDDGKPKSAEWFYRSINFALQGLALPGCKVLCHCAAGINRGPSTAYALLRALGFPRLLARVMIVAARPITLAGIAYRNDADQAIYDLGYGPKMDVSQDWDGPTTRMYLTMWKFANPSPTPQSPLDAARPPQL